MVDGCFMVDRPWINHPGKAINYVLWLIGYLVFRIDDRGFIWGRPFLKQFGHGTILAPPFHGFRVPTKILEVPGRCFY